MTTDAIATHGLVKRHRNLRSLRDALASRPQRASVAGLDFTAPTGGITGLLGPNGAGKSTTVRLLLGLARPTAGTATVLGHDVVRDSLEIRRQVAYVPAERELFGRMRAGELIAGVAALSTKWDADYADRLVRDWRVDRGKRMRELSSGTRSRLLLLVALARRASLLILDEPTTGLDPEAVDEALSELATAAADGSTVLLVTHRLEEVERICDRVVVMRDGRALLESDLDDLRASWRVIDAAGHPAPERSKSWAEVADVTPMGEHHRLLVQYDADAVMDRLRLIGAEVTGVRGLTLREIYLAVTRTDRADDPRDDLA